MACRSIVQPVRPTTGLVHAVSQAHIEDRTLGGHGSPGLQPRQLFTAWRPSLDYPRLGRHRVSEPRLRDVHSRVVAVPSLLSCVNHAPESSWGRPHLIRGLYVRVSDGRMHVPRARHHSEIRSQRSCESTADVPRVHSGDRQMAPSPTVSLPGIVPENARPALTRMQPRRGVEPRLTPSQRRAGNSRSRCASHHCGLIYEALLRRGACCDVSRIMSTQTRGTKCRVPRPPSPEVVACRRRRHSILPSVTVAG